MDKILLKFGKVLKGTVIGPIKASKNYAKSKILLRKYEKVTGITPLHKLKKKVYRSNENFVDLTNEIENSLIKILTSSASNTTDVYFNEQGIPEVSCSYQVTQNLLNKNTKLICNCISSSAIANFDYYYLALSVKHNVITDQTEDIITRLTAKIG